MILVSCLPGTVAFLSKNNTSKAGSKAIVDIRVVSLAGNFSLAELTRNPYSLMRLLSFCMQRQRNDPWSNCKTRTEAFGSAP